MSIHLHMTALNVIVCTYGLHENTPLARGPDATLEPDVLHTCNKRRQGWCARLIFQGLIFQSLRCARRAEMAKPCIS